ncbi:hypothetical protein [Alkalicoccobacillus murimartini]|uniref:Uncharacterized protein n=1 Tax=Alkalicoccobacillus murimartini TaxID=171685 RepID=A0ABT9YGK9_9BACI|nr:hypothetical protein [Alkalicoccobacillus murimartini]MDQ0206960.1 hypothetical protein [Alkalicoccobacillus murimartini]
MSRMKTFRLFLVIVFSIIAGLEFVDVLTFYGQPAVRFSMISAFILMMIYKVFEAKKEEKNHHYS